MVFTDLAVFVDLSVLTCFAVWRFVWALQCDSLRGPTVCTSVAMSACFHVCSSSGQNPGNRWEVDTGGDGAIFVLVWKHRFNLVKNDVPHLDCVATHATLGMRDTGWHSVQVLSECCFERPSDSRRATTLHTHQTKKRHHFMPVLILKENKLGLRIIKKIKNFNDWYS